MLGNVLTEVERHTERFIYIKGDKFFKSLREAAQSEGSEPIYSMKARSAQKMDVETKRIESFHVDLRQDLKCEKTGQKGFLVLSPFTANYPDEVWAAPQLNLTAEVKKLEQAVKVALETLEVASITTFDGGKHELEATQALCADAIDEIKTILKDKRP